MIFMMVNAERDFRTNTFKVKRVTLPMDHKTFISNARRKSAIISNIDRNIVTNISKSWRILPKLTLTSRIRKEIGKVKSKITTFNKLQYSRNKTLKRNNHHQENEVNISNKYMNNNDFRKSEEISIEESFRYKTPKLEIITPKNEETHVKRPQSKTTSLSYSKNSQLKYADTINNISVSDESDDLKQYIFVYIPLINLEHVNKNSDHNSGRKNVVNNVRIRRGVIEEEISATTSSGFKYTAAESSLVDRLTFKNIKV
ncbi:unnamed protein product [Parnassius apollo]|uniref:(apollo) hypothetical protein n=1 Tax=Parnassius apollo TaxID=110799 RepID=A0A8S3Y3G0_PARAO|nr:unnamed protein product [Parnassius apollo]